MARKSRSAHSGHMPLTNYERAKYGKQYGTTAQRLAGESQITFGDCGLSLGPAKDTPVATPSGHIYERPAILEYMLVKTQELKQAQADYEKALKEETTKESEEAEQKRKAEIDSFEDQQKVFAKKQKVEASNPLKATSYWLAEFQPEAKKDTAAGLVPPPKRPPSPHSHEPLARKSLIPLQLKWNSSNQVVCAISDKSIVSQPAVALVPKSGDPAQVVLESVYNDLGKEKVCPVTGQRLKQVLRLVRGGSSFAASGKVVAKTYKPTMT